MVARCRLRERAWWPSRPGLPAPCWQHAGPAPAEGCRCGIYAATTAAQAAASITEPPRPRERIVHHVIGRISLWGTVVECERGWRAERAYPASLAVPAPRRRRRRGHILRPRRQQPRSRSAAEIAGALCEYGVPIELVACETLGELAAALEAHGGAARSGRTLILSAGERAALLATLRRSTPIPSRACDGCQREHSARVRGARPGRLPGPPLRRGSRAPPGVARAGGERS